MATLHSSQSPHNQIKSMLFELVTNIYGIDWVPRVVRQHKRLNVGTLDFIDYAVPCYELAQKLNTDPKDLALDIEHRLRQLNASEFKAEAIEGYVNFQLSESVFQEMRARSIEWYSSPHLGGLSGLHKVNFAVVGLNITSQPDLGTTDRARAYLQQIYKEVGISTKSKFLVGDYSNEMIDPLFELLENDGMDRLSLYRSIRSFLSKPDSLKSGSSVSRVHKEMLRNWIAMNEVDTHSEDDLIFESNLSTEAHSFLDDYESSESFEMLKDEASLAVYYVGEHDTLPLRSASGILYTPAFILYLLSKEIHELDQNDALVVVGSHRLSLLISTYIKSLVNNFDSRKTVIYFDPRVSKADITELYAKAPNVKDFLKVAVGCLRLVQDDDLRDGSKRQAVLSLLDLPIEINDFILRQSLPQLFDSINLATEALEVIQSPASHVYHDL